MVDGADSVRRADTAADRIVFLGHATVLVELEGVRLLFDPFLRGRVLHLRRQVAPVEESVFAAPHAVLISHSHHDHLDPASLRRLGRDTPLIVPSGAGAWLAGKGFANVSEMDVGEVRNVAGLQITAVAAHHDGRRMWGPRAKALGYLLAGRHVVYFAGDTELFAGMGGFCPAPDVALLPVAGWGPKLGPGHMDPLQAAQAVELLGPRLAIPIHWGTLLPIGLARNYRARLGDPPHLFAAHVAQMTPSVQVRILSPGEQTSLSGCAPMEPQKS
ncbi:MAG TPA: MBL fold metallo-hydrolase [Solirubrobacteraceae bacterium]|jgi:L-ascorbate metabolism protein UlaG (beta-lactamase superfamily)|nr:MBL fold metallo-hydrolase [Solirubrobacteraceae bacterium]